MKAKLLTTKERKEIIKLFLNGKDNRVSVIAEKVGVSIQKVDRAINKYLKTKKL